MGKRKTNEEFLQQLKNLGRTDVEPLEEYKNNYTKIKFRCTDPECNYEWKASPKDIIRGRGCPICGIKKRTKAQTKTHEQFLKDFKKTGNKNVKIIGIYKNNKTKIKVQCIKNDKHIWEASPIHLLHGKGCPFCRGLKVNETNSVKNLRPDLAKYFKNKKDSEIYSINSNKKVILKCPSCGYEKEMSINELSNKGFYCNICNDGISFPNKLIANILKELHINFKLEVNFKWSKKYRYDAYFEYENKRYLIEMDGDQHFSDNNGWKTSLEKTQKRDKEKNELAKTNGFILIRINCNTQNGKEKTRDFIIENIKNSELSNIFDLNKIDFNKCIINSEKSILVKVCKYYNKHKNLSFNKIGRMFNLNGTTVKRYIMRGVKAGICDEMLKYKKIDDVKILVYKDKKLIRIYSNIIKCSRYLNKEFNIKISKNTLYKKLRKSGDNIELNGFVIYRY